jgi:hypothetical protein
VGQPGLLAGEIRSQVRILGSDNLTIVAERNVPTRATLFLFK